MAVQNYAQAVAQDAITLAGGYIAGKAYDYMYPPYNITSFPARKKRRKLRQPTFKSGRRYGAFRSESKFSDSQLVGTAIATSWTTQNPTTLDSLSAVAQGTTESTHLGRTMYMTSIHMRGQVILDVAESEGAPPSDVTVRIAIVLDTDTKATEVTATDVYDAGQTSDIFAFRNLQHTSRLKVLRHKLITLHPFNLNEGSINLFANGNRVRDWQFNYTFKKPVRVLFSGTTAVVGSIVDNSLHFVTIATASGATITYQSRLRFKDTLP